MEIEENINYISCGLMPNMKWSINIPYAFLKRLAMECINNYLSDCQINNRDSYSNSKEYNSWYE